MACIACVHAIGDECSPAQCSAAARAEGYRESTGAGGSCTKGCAAEGFPLFAACSPASPTCVSMPICCPPHNHILVLVNLPAWGYREKAWFRPHAFYGDILQVHGDCQQHMCRRHVRRRQSPPSPTMSLRALIWRGSAADPGLQAPLMCHPRRRTSLRSGLPPIDTHPLDNNTSTCRCIMRGISPAAGRRGAWQGCWRERVADPWEPDWCKASS